MLTQEIKRPKSLRSDTAWARRNLLVAAINSGLEQGLFTLKPGPVEDQVYRFFLSDLPVLARAKDIGWDEVSIYALVLPTKKGEEFLDARCHSIHLEMGEAVAHGWLERRTRKHLQDGSMFRCRKALLQRLAAAQVTPRGFKDHGRLFL
jgi:hypothetical protein